MIPKDMVRLRIAGVFYDRNFQATGLATIKDLLDLAVLTEQGRLDYLATAKYKVINNMGVLCHTVFGFTHRLKDELQPSLGDKQRLAGQYQLFQSTSVDSGSVTVHAWQYYIIRPDSNPPSNYFNGNIKQPEVSPAKPLPFPGSKPGFTPFDKAEIKGGDEVVWRNVAIVRNPQTEPAYQ